MSLRLVVLTGGSCLKQKQCLVTWGEENTHLPFVYLDFVCHTVANDTIHNSNAINSLEKVSFKSSQSLDCFTDLAFPIRQCFRIRAFPPNQITQGAKFLLGVCFKGSRLLAKLLMSLDSVDQVEFENGR